MEIEKSKIKDPIQLQEEFGLTSEVFQDFDIKFKTHSDENQITWAWGAVHKTLDIRFGVAVAFTHRSFRVMNYSPIKGINVLLCDILNWAYYGRPVDFDQTKSMGLYDKETKKWYILDSKNERVYG